MLANTKVSNSQPLEPGRDKGARSGNALVAPGGRHRDLLHPFCAGDVVTHRVKGGLQGSGGRFVEVLAAAHLLCPFNGCGGACVKGILWILAFLRNSGIGLVIRGSV